MARTKTKERATSRVDVEMGATGGPQPPSKLAVTLLGVCILAVIWAVMMMVPAGRVAYVYIFSYSEFYMGVLTLVSLSITIMVGLVSTDRLVLTIRQRLLLQSTHRTTGVIAVASLGVHLWTKYAMGKMQFIDAFIPFLNPGKTLFIGFGTLSGWIMVLVMWTGIARARFIGRGRPWMWRGIHSISYLMWPIALLHGLNAGRPAAVWVIVSYVICVLMVLIGLAVRIAVSLNRKKDFASQQGTAGGNTGAMKPVGRMGAAVPGRGKSRSRRDDDALVSDRGNAVQAWKPAAPRPAPAAAPAAPMAAATSEQPVVKPVSAAPAPAAAPISPAPMAVPVAEERRPRRDDDRRPRRDADERARRRRDYEDVPTQRWEFEDEDDMPAQRGRRRPVDAYDEELPAPRQRRAAEHFDEPTGPISRRALEDRRYDDEDDVPAPRGRGRRAAEEYDEAPRARRYAEPEFDDQPDFDDEPAPRPRGRRFAEASYAAETAAMPAPPRPRRAAFDDDEVPAPRPRRAVFEDFEDEAPAPRQRRYADEDPRYDDPRYDEAPPRRRAARYPGEQPRSSRAARYAGEEEEVPRARRDRGADVDRADSGRHSRSEFVDLGAPDDPNYLEPDETPTLVDMAQRRARRATQQESVRTGTGRGARRGSRPTAVEEADDATYWAQLRGEAQ